MKSHDHVVTSELALLINASDNNAHIKCEAANSATIYPMSQKLILKVLCKFIKYFTVSPSAKIFHESETLILFISYSSSREGENNDRSKGI